MSDLIILVPDKDIEQSLIGILQRTESIGIRNITYDIYKHDQKDPGVRTDAHHFLRPFINKYDNALVIFDYEGCGIEHTSPEELEQQINSNLQENGWSNNIETIIINPEFEVWGWIDSPHFYTNIGWTESYQDLEHFLITNNFQFNNRGKPIRPKEAVEFIMENNNWPRSSSAYKKIASLTSFKSCQDRAFLKLLDTLRKWYAP